MQVLQILTGSGPPIDPTRCMVPAVAPEAGGEHRVRFRRGPDRLIAEDKGGDDDSMPFERLDGPRDSRD